MGRALFWGCLGFFICIATSCPLIVAFIVTIVTTVIGCLDFHPGEYVIVGAVVVAVAIILHRGHLSPLGIALGMLPIVFGAALFIWFLATNPKRRRAYEAAYRTLRQPERKQRVTAEPIVTVVEHHHYFHHVPNIPCAALARPARHPGPRHATRCHRPGYLAGKVLTGPPCRAYPCPIELGRARCRHS